MAKATHRLASLKALIDATPALDFEPGRAPVPSPAVAVEPNGPVPQRPLYDDGLHMSDEELTAAIAASIGVRSNTAELPTCDEVRALRRQGKEVVFTQLALQQARELPDLSDELARRPRLEGVVFSIDPYDVPDLDNALGYRRGEDGSHYVSVLATDVAAYIRPGTALDYAARRRAETRYLDEAGLVLPMLPLFLSEGQLSFFTGEERLAKATELHFSDDGQLLGTRIFNTVITNTQVSPEDGAKALQGKGRLGGNKPLAETLAALTALGARVNGGTAKGGSISVDKLTPVFTQLAAIEVGRALRDVGLEASFRNQEERNAKSTYGATPKGHAGIGTDAYATFTGPMRRYSDLDVQRSIDRMLAGKKPAGRLLTLDHQLRELQLGRENHLFIPERLQNTREVIEITRRAQPGPPLPVPTEPPQAPEE
ncbi:MAG: RNB domain-containing ribonuclease [Archangiaceae bacterium]|nr:RNB domain-containing ribonuclease [Archangiaceae bacterium]